LHLIRYNEIVAENVGKMIVEAPYVAEHRKAGQFIILIIDEFGERIPFTIADADREEGIISLFYQIVGKSTDKLSAMKAGDSISDIAGPLGHATDIKIYGTVLCIGGGIGMAPLYPIAKSMKDAGNRLLVVQGARKRDLLILEDEFREIADEYLLFTDDGSKGDKGFVTHGLERFSEKEKVDLVVAIGPVPMMKAVSDLTREMAISTIVSLNSIMVDGTGMCGGCRVTVGGETLFTCVDGPEFDAHLVDFEELMSRQKTYNQEERESHELHKHKCRLDDIAANGK